MSTSGMIDNQMPPLLAAVEIAKQELRQEFDEDVMALGTAIFGTTTSEGRLTKMGLLHSFMAMDRVLAYLCEKFGVTPADVEKWHEDKVKRASQPAETKVKLD